MATTTTITNSKPDIRLNIKPDTKQNFKPKFDPKFDPKFNPKFELNVQMVDLEDDKFANNLVGWVSGDTPGTATEITLSQCSLKKVSLDITVLQTKFNMLLANKCIGDHFINPRTCYMCCKYGNRKHGDDMLDHMIRMLDCKAESNMGICYVKKDNTVKLEVTPSHILYYNYDEWWPSLRVELMKALHET